jgi:hypothetical protein
MFLLENLKRTFEGVTGRGRPTRRQVRARVTQRRPQTFLFRDDGKIPNNPALPLVLYQQVVRLDRAADPAAIFEELFAANG